jgi:hypothetical protein
MKPFILFFFLLCSTFQLSAQKFPGLDKSPMDVSYYPHDFAHDRKFAPDKIGGADAAAVVRVIYSRPAKKEREVFGKLIPFGKMWRLGANEATEIKFYQDVTFGGKPVKAGTYALFAIPDQGEWTIVLNSELDHWGAYSYKENLDVLRVKVPIKSTTDVVENLAIAFEKADAKAATMRIGWDKTMVEVPVEWK